MKLERRLDHIKVLESDSNILSKNTGQCIHCHERHYLIQKIEDLNNMFCTNCGNVTPLRTIKHSRGLSAPSIQQETIVASAKSSMRAKNRMPRGIDRKPNELAKSLLEKGFQVIRSDTLDHS